PLKELLLALALVAHPSVEIDECLDLVVADRGGRDHVPTVGVADKHDRAGQRPQELGEVRRVASEVAKRIGEPDDAESFALESANLGIEARGIGPCPVDENDRRSAVVGHVCSSRAVCPWTAVSSLPGTPSRRKLVDHTASQRQPCSTKREARVSASPSAGLSC